MGLSEDLSEVYRDVNVHYKNNYRCRYNPLYMSIHPLEKGEEFRQEDHCCGCKHRNSQDPYCSSMKRTWQIIMSLPESEKAKYICTCPDIPCASKL